MQTRRFTFSRWIMALAVMVSLMPWRAGAETFEQRAAMIVDAAARAEITGDCNHKVKSGIYYVMAKFEKGDISGARSLWNQLYEMGFCGSMFTIMNSMGCYLRYKEHYTSEMIGRQKSFMSGYNYFSSTQEKRNPEGMTGTSENHYLMSATGGYLAAEEWSDFSAKGVSGSEILRRTRNHIYHAIEQLCKYGIKEYDSPTYHVFYVNAYTFLSELAAHAEMRRRAAIALDMSLATIAAQWQHGVLCASTLRTYGLNADHDGLIGPTGWLYWGGHTMPSIGDGTAVASAVADYRVPDAIYQAGTDRSQPYVHRESDDRLPPDIGSRINWPAGFRETAYMGKRYGVFTQYDGNGLLGWSDQMMRAGIAWHGGRLIWQPMNDPGIQYLQNGPAVVGISLVSLSESKAGISQTLSGDGWSFMKGGDAVYIAYIKSGKGFAVQTADTDEYANLGAFKDAVLSGTSFSSSGETAAFTDLGGDRLAITYDGRGWDAFDAEDTDRQTINGERVVYGDWPRIDNPWMHGEVGGSEIVMQAGDSRRVYDLASWTVTDEAVTGGSAPAPGPTGSVRMPGRATLYTVSGRLVETACAGTSTDRGPAGVLVAAPGRGGAARLLLR